MATSSAQSQSDSFGIVFRPLNRNRINKLKTTATSSLKHLKNRIVTNQVSKLALFTMQTKWKKCRHFPTSTRPGDFFCCGFKLTSVRNLFHYFYSIEFFTHCVAAWRENFPNPPWTNKAVKKSLILKKALYFIQVLRNYATMYHVIGNDRRLCGPYKRIPMDSKRLTCINWLWRALSAVEFQVAIFFVIKMKFLYNCSIELTAMN